MKPRKYATTGTDLTYGQAHSDWLLLPEEVKEEMIRRVHVRSLVNTEAEQMLLGTILADNRAYHDASFLKPEDFGEDIHAEIFRDIAKLVSQGKTATPTTLATRYNLDPLFEEVGGARYLASLISAGMAFVNVGEYADVIRELSRRRMLHSALFLHAQSIVSPSVMAGSAEASEALLSDVIGLCGSMAKNQIATLQQVARDVYESLDTDKDPDSTGITELDKTLVGGFYPGKIYDFNAKMKIGKTMLLTTMYTNVVRNAMKARADELFAIENGHDIPLTPLRPVLYICAEMGEKEITQRILSRLLGVNSMSFLTKKNDEDFRQKVSTAVDMVHALPGLFYDAKGLPLSELQTVLFMAVHRWKIRGFVLDSFNLVTPSQNDRFENATKFSEHCANWLLAFCKEHQVWCATANQISTTTNKVRGGDVASMYFDAQLELERDESTEEAWLTTKMLRYAPPRNVGDKRSPSLRMVKEGPYFVGILDAMDVPKNTLQHGLEEIEI